jgi:hypothetical protein
MSACNDENQNWLSTEQVARRVGMTPEWVRRQIVAGRLSARVFRTGDRATYRIAERAFREFMRRWSRRTDDPDWETFAGTGQPLE